MNIPFAGIMQDEREILAAMRVLLSGWHAQGQEANALEKELAEYTGAKYAVVMSSGTMANFNSLIALDLPQGSEVITSGVGFPATLIPIIRAGHKPVLVDYDINTQNISIDEIEDAITPQTKAIVLAHTMGLPLDMPRVMKIANKHKLKVIEDCCEALGSRIKGKHVGTFGDFGTFSFYPSHQINGLGGGGAVITNNKEYALRLRSLRDWGKFQDKTYFKGDHTTAFDIAVDGINYDEQYVYQTLGMNSRMPDILCAYTREQLKKLDEFVKIRKRNWKRLADNFNHPIIVGEPSYFGFTLISKERDKLSDYLIKNGIKTRPFFAGNITRHKPFENYKQEFPIGDFMMECALFVGVWQGIDEEKLNYMIEKIKEFG